MYRVSEVAKILSVSKVTIYKKVNSLNQQIKPHVFKRKGITYIDKTGLQMIKETLGVNPTAKEVKSTVKTPVKDNEETPVISESVKGLKDKNDGLNYEYIEMLKEQINYLKDELTIKNDQLKGKDEQLNTKDELIRNFQVLLKEDKDRILLLEEKLEKNEVIEDQQTIITKKIMSQVREENKKLIDYVAATREEEKKQSFWKRLFGK